MVKKMRKDKVIKILTINTVGLNTNGITTVMFDYYSRFSIEQFDIHTITDVSNDKSIVDNFKSAGIMVHKLPNRKKSIIRYFISLIILIYSNKFDVVHVHGNSATESIELLAAKLAGCKVRIAHSHNSTCDAKRADNILRPLFYRLYTHAFACGQLAGEWLFQDRYFKIVKNGRDINKYSFDEKTRFKVRKDLGLDETTLAVGHIGNFNKQKNHEYLIKIFEELKKIKRKSKLFLAGYGHCEKEIHNMVRQLNLEQDVIFLGGINNVSSILQAMDIMVLPSLYEGLPLVVVEWQIAALPCVISDTITQECVYTDLVEFEKLESSYHSWAVKIIQLAIRNRIESKDYALKQSVLCGFDINSNSTELMSYIKNLVHK